MKIILYSLFVAFYASSGLALPELCGQEPQIKWCFFAGAVKSQKNSTVIYYFHGNGENEQYWESPMHTELLSHWPQRPSIISISFGKSWFLEKNKISSLLNAIPLIEKQVSLLAPERFLLGESMGGLNAAILANHHQNYFNKIASLCPALYTISPFAPAHQVNQYLQAQTNHVATVFIPKWLNKIKQAYGSLANWDLYNPLTSPTPDSPIFIAVNQEDTLGLTPGAVELKNQWGLPPQQWQLVPGSGHCSLSPESLKTLADFFQK